MGLWLEKSDGFPIKLNLFLPSRVKVNSAVQTHLYSATRGYKWYFLFLTNTNIVFALKIHYFSWKIFPPCHLSPRSWILLGRWTVQEGGHAVWERGSAWDMGILFSSELLYKFSSFNMVKCKWQKKVFFQTVEDKGKIPSSERMDRIVGDTIPENLFHLIFHLGD